MHKKSLTTQICLRTKEVTDPMIAIIIPDKTETIKAAATSGNYTTTNNMGMKKGIP